MLNKAVSGASVQGASSHFKVFAFHLQYSKPAFLTQLSGIVYEEHAVWSGQQPDLSFFRAHLSC